MDLTTYTVFYCTKHSTSIIIENIHKNIPENIHICNDSDNCINKDWTNVGHITVNNTNSIIIFDNNRSINLLNLSNDSIFSKTLQQIKLDDMNLLSRWLNEKTYIDLD